jgi:hypothetical protein
MIECQLAMLYPDVPPHLVIVWKETEVCGIPYNHMHALPCLVKHQRLSFIICACSRHKLVPLEVDELIDETDGVHEEDDLHPYAHQAAIQCFV